MSKRVSSGWTILAVWGIATAFAVACMYACRRFVVLLIPKELADPTMGALLLAMAAGLVYGWMAEWVSNRIAERLRLKSTPIPPLAAGLTGPDSSANQLKEP